MIWLFFYAGNFLKLIRLHPVRKVAVLISLLSILGVFGQNGKYPMGARNAAIGGASLTLGDQWSLFNNIGALALSRNNIVFTSYQNRFNLSEFQIVGAGYVHTIHKVVAGLGVFRFGDELFSEQRVNLAVSHKLDRVSLGAGVDYLQYNVSTVGTKSALLIEFGGVAEITDQVWFGAHVFNINQAELSFTEREKLPVVMKAGISFRPSAELMINLETEKDLDFDEVFHLGLEYQLIETVYLRTGFNTSPFNGAFGLGFYPKQFQFDYSFSEDANLGSIHEISVSFIRSLR